MVIRHSIQLTKINRQHTSEIIKANKTALKTGMVTLAQYFIWSLYQKGVVNIILWKLGSNFSALKSLQILSFYTFQTSRVIIMCTTCLQTFQTLFHFQTGLTRKITESVCIHLNDCIF